MENHTARLERRPGYLHQKRSNWNGRGNPAYLQGAAVVIDNETGAVLASVGGRSANESQFNRALQAKRQIGSLFKPFIFLAAFDRGLTPNQIVSDAPLQAGEIPGAQPGWSPANSDKRYFAEIPAKRLSSNPAILPRSELGLRRDGLSHRGGQCRWIQCR